MATIDQVMQQHPTPPPRPASVPGPAEQDVVQDTAPTPSFLLKPEPSTFKEQLRFATLSFMGYIPPLRNVLTSLKEHTFSFAFLMLVLGIAIGLLCGTRLQPTQKPVVAPAVIAQAQVAAPQNAPKPVVIENKPPETPKMCKVVSDGTMVIAKYHFAFKDAKKAYRKGQISEAEYVKAFEAAQPIPANKIIAQSRMSNLSEEDLCGTWIGKERQRLILGAK